MLTIDAVAHAPEMLTYPCALPDGQRAVLRPLEPNDDTGLAEFLESLSPQTREYYVSEGYDLAAARALCDAIARYDKLRFVVEASGRVVGLIEFSFAIMDTERDRFARYGITLDPETDVRFGPCLADDFQGRGIGSVLMPAITDIAARFGKRRIVLWGGVLASNDRAIRYYEKSGFRMFGSFIDKLGDECRDGLLVLVE